MRVPIALPYSVTIGDTPKGKPLENKLHNGAVCYTIGAGKAYRQAVT